MLEHDLGARVAVVEGAAHFNRTQEPHVEGLVRAVVDAAAGAPPNVRRV